MTIRQIALDTETTGLSPEKGHRLIEIACVEIIDRRLTGRHYQTYLNPERLIDPEAIKIHGIEDLFLKDKPLFTGIVEEFLAFVKGAELIIHNAAFDLGFLNAELKRHSKKNRKLEADYKVIDTLLMARELHPGQRNNLDALCKRYGIDNTARDLHGALIDAELLAKTYLSMTAGQNSLFVESSEGQVPELKVTEKIEFMDLPVIRANSEELKIHCDMMRAIEK